jgi:HPt (histidine-containing phosphotransfer) domain-containing protein
MSDTFCDFEMLSMSFEGDEDILLELVEDFQAEFPKMISDIEEAYTNENIQDLERHAHTLKGVVSNFFCEEIKNAAFVIEEQAHNGNTDDYELNIKIIKEKLPAMTAEVHEFCSKKLAA